MHELVTTVLDVVGLLLLAAGVVVGLVPWVGGWAFSAGGVVVLAGSWWAARPPRKASRL